MGKEKLEVIKERYREFATFLDGIAIEEIEKEYSRSELKELSKELSNINLRSFSYEITKMIQKKKEEEYPELLGIHHYPVLKEIDFLSEDKKLELDKFLARFVVGNELSGLSRMMYSKDLKRFEEFLIEKGIAEAKFYAFCPRCHSGWISRLLTLEEMKLVEALLKDKKNEDRSENLEGYLEYCCSQCDEEAEFERIDTVNFGRLLKIVQGRNKSLDNV